MIESLDALLRTLTDTFGKLYGLPSYVLVFLACLVAGFGLKKWKRFPNDAIPLVVVLTGGLLNSLIADPKADTLPLRIWIVKNALIGLIMGFAAWQAHANRKRIPLLKRCFNGHGGDDSDPAAFTQPPEQEKKP